jgi:hypothetical protein
VRKHTSLALLAATAVALLAILSLLWVMGQLAAPKEPEATYPVTFTSPGSEHLQSNLERPTTQPINTSRDILEPGTVIASVDGISITMKTWQDVTLVDGVMNQLAEQPAPSADETLDHLINEILLVRAAGLEDVRPFSSEVESRINDLQDQWGLGQKDVEAALQHAGLNYETLVQRVGRLIVVERAIDVLSTRYTDLDAWLNETRQRANIEFYHTTD